MIAILLAAALAPSGNEASASITVQSALKISSVAPIHLRPNAVNTIATINVAGDPNRAYRLQVQTYIPQEDGGLQPTSAAWAEAGPSQLAHVDATGTARINLNNIGGLVQRGPNGRPVLPVRVVYE